MKCGKYEQEVLMHEVRYTGMTSEGIKAILKLALMFYKD